jgi:hypothetical protein
VPRVAKLGRRVGSADSDIRRCDHTCRR